MNLRKKMLEQSAEAKAMAPKDLNANLTRDGKIVVCGDISKIEITSEESDRVFKAPLAEEAMPVKRYKIFKDIHKERLRQHEKWGDQKISMTEAACAPDMMAANARLLKSMNDSGERSSWFYVLMEEVYEAFSETDLARQREELIQVAAVAVQIIEGIDKAMEE
jgi:hypothetical protein